MPASVAMPAVRQNRSKLAPTCCQASSTIAAGTTPAGVVDSFMALLSFVDSAPRAYRLKAGNAYLTFSTSTGTSPFRVTVFPPLALPRSGEPYADAAALMAQVNATLEAWIRERPEQWLWVHRRCPD